MSTTSTAGGSLPYEDFTIRGVEAVSGEPQPGGQILPLVEKIRFRDNR